MNLYEKVTAFLKLNKVREKDIVMVYGYTPEKILIIAPDLFKKSFSKYDYDDIDFDTMTKFIVFGLDYITQKTWVLAILGDVTTWKIKRYIRYCKEFYNNDVSQKLLKDKIDEQIDELANDFQGNNADIRLMKVLSEYFRHKPSEEDKKQIIEDSIEKSNNVTKKLYDRNQRLFRVLKSRVYDYDDSSMYDTAMKEFSIYNKKEDNTQEEE